MDLFWVHTKFRLDIYEKSENFWQTFQFGNTADRCFQVLDAKLPLQMFVFYFLHQRRKKAFPFSLKLKETTPLWCSEGWEFY